MSVGQSIYQVDRYVDVNTRGTALLLDILVNARRWQSLTDAQRNILRQAAKEAGDPFRKESERGFTEKRQRAEKEFGVTVYEPDLTPWRRMAPTIIQAL